MSRRALVRYRFVLWGTRKSLTMTDRQPGFYWAQCELRVRIHQDECTYETRIEVVEVDKRGHVLFIDGAMGTVERWGPRLAPPSERDALNWENCDD